MNKIHLAVRLFTVTLASIFLSLSVQAQTPKPGTAVKGNVVDSDGRPVAGATVQQYEYALGPGNRFELEMRQEAMSDANGAFELRGAGSSAMPHASLFLIARKPGLASAWFQSHGPAGKEPRLVLTPPSFLAGVVVDESEKPVAGAEVSVFAAFNETVGEGASRSFSYLTDKPARGLFLAKTGADGRFRIENFPTNASATLVAAAPGKAQRSTGQQNFSPEAMPHKPGQDDIRLAMEPAGSVEGKIIAGEAGSQPPAARITVLPEGPSFFSLGTRPEVISRADGVFRLDSLPAGSYRIQAIFGTNQVADWVAETVPVSVESGKATPGIEISAIRGGLLEIAVRSTKEATAIDGANVNLFKPGYQSGLPTGTNGTAVLRLPPGDYQVNAYKTGWQPANASASVEAGLTNRVELEMAPPRKLMGTVRYPDGQPATNLAVQIVGDHSMQQATILTDSAGKFEQEWAMQRFPGQDMIPCLFVRDPDRNLAVAQDLDEDTEQLDLRLAPAVSFVALVQSDAKPLTNAMATFVFWTGNSGMHLNNLSARTATPGQVEFVALPTGRRYSLQVSAPGYGSKYVDLSQSADEAKRVELEPVDLRRADRKIAGKLVDPEDKPVSGAMVQIHGDGQPNGNVSTDREGRFSFDVCEGSIRLFAHSQNQFANISAEGGDTNVVMKLGEQSMDHGGGGKPQKITGTATDEAGQPVAGADVRVFLAEMPKRIKTDTNGVFEASYTVQPWQRQNGNPLLLIRDRARNLAVAHEVLEEETNVVVRLEPGLTVRGRVVGPKSEPLANAQVNLTLQTGRMGGQVDDQPVVTDKQGAFAFTALPATENYSINVSLSGYSQKNQNVDAPWDTNLVEVPTIALRIPNQILAGQVVDAKDKPISGAQVQISSNDQPQASTQTDSKGRFKLKVCEGTVRMFVHGPAGYAQTSAEAGDTNVIIVLADRSAQSRPATRRKASNSAALKGKPLPNLTSLGFVPDAVPAGKPVLLCLLNVQERPSRRMARDLVERQDHLRQNGVTLLAAQTVPATDEAWQEWKEIDPGLPSISRLTEKSDQNKWATSLESLPWLILVDKQGVVTDEGFPLQDLELKLLDLEE